MKKALILLVVLVLLAGLLFGLYHFLWTADNFAALGEKAMKSGNYARAVDRYTTAVSLAPDNVDYVLALADACLADGSYTRAERTLVEAIRTAPSEQLYRRLSATYVAQDKLLDAQQMLDSITDPAIRASLEAARPAAPALTPDGGEFSDYITVSVSAPTGTVYVSVTEQYPSTADAPYAEPIALPAGSTHVSAIAVGDDGLVSPLTEADYLIVGVVEEVTFTDSAFEQYVRDLILKPSPSVIYTSDLWAVTEFVMPEEVTDFSDLHYFTGLHSLTIHNGMFDDYTFLMVMPYLEKLDLSGSLVSAQTLEYIGTLTDLSDLNLSGCGLSNIVALSGAKAMEHLDLSDNSISNIGALSNYSGLKTADLSRNAITAIDALDGLTKLTALDLSENDITSVSALAKCTEMTELKLASNRITSVAPLSGMRALTKLDLSKNALTDVSGLGSCLQLTELRLSDNQLENVDSAASLVNLTYLDMSHNLVKELPPFTETCRLQQFYGSYNQLSDISGLAGLPELNYVDVDYNTDITDIECLKACQNLVQVNAFGTKITHVTELSDMGVVVYWDPTSTIAG
ncbi:MAG: leucine-rich repeat domain-containing protein [Oscillospiraceae bacterium]